ncbi:response regulator [Deltaproteobacteria bacterium TL4]
MKILVLDDDPILREIVSEYVQEAGHEIEVAENGVEGWDLFSTRPHDFQAMIIDVRMPVMDGLTFVKKIRKQGFHLPIIMMTGDDEERYSAEFLKLGVKTILPKPFELHELHDVLKKLDSI